MSAGVSVSVRRVGIDADDYMLSPYNARFNSSNVSINSPASPQLYSCIYADPSSPRAVRHRRTRSYVQCRPLPYESSSVDNKLRKSQETPEFAGVVVTEADGKAASLPSTACGRCIAGQTLFAKAGLTGISKDDRDVRSFGAYPFLSETEAAREKGAKAGDQPLGHQRTRYGCRAPYSRSDVGQIRLLSKRRRGSMCV